MSFNFDYESETLNPSPLGNGLELGIDLGRVLSRVVPVRPKDLVEVGYSDSDSIAIFASRRKVIVESVQSISDHLRGNRPVEGIFR